MPPQKAAIFSKCVCISFISLPCVNLQPLVTSFESLRVNSLEATTSLTQGAWEELCEATNYAKWLSEEANFSCVTGGNPALTGLRIIDLMFLRAFPL